MLLRCITLAFALFLILPALSAQYEFAPIGATWVYNVPVNFIGGTPHPLKDYFIHESTGDTLVDSLNYRKVGPNLLYQTGQKVFFRHNDSLHLAYDFGLNEGDTTVFCLFSINDQLIDVKMAVINIDTVLVNNQPLKSFYLTSVWDWDNPWVDHYQYEYLEKIGSSVPIGNGIKYNIIIPEFIPEWLRCYHDATTNYQSPRYLLYNKPDCYYRPPSAAGEVALLEISVSPNPFVDYFTIQSPEFPVESVALYNALGQRVWHLNSPDSPQQDIKITAGHLAPGVYHCWLQSGPQTRVVKLVKE